MIETILYAVIGVVLVANLGTVVAVWIASIKVAVTFGRLSFNVERNTSDVGNAFKKLRAHDDRLLNLEQEQ